jgi:2-methylcitrate dehydratase PrpD
VCVIPVSLALGEQYAASGRSLLAAIVAGYEAMVLAVGPVHHTTLTTGWHGTKVGGVFGAAAAAAAMLGLDSGRTAHALAIAGSDASGTMEYDQSGGEVKRLHPAMAARSGLEAAMLAASGMTGPLTIFEGKRGIYRLFGDGSEPDIDGCWGTEFHIRNVIFKLYPAVGTHHAALDGLRHLLDEHPVKADEVTQVVVSVAPWAVAHGGATGQPTDVISAQFNLGFSLALRLVEGSNALPLYLDHTRWTDPDIVAMVNKVVVQPMSFEPGDSELGSQIDLTLTDGRHLCRRQPTFRGHTDDPADAGDIEVKFLELVDGLLPPGRAERIIETVSTLEELSDVRQLTALFQA